MSRIEEIMRVAKVVQPEKEPLIASSLSSTHENVLVETVGASVPRRNRGEGIIFTVKAQLERESVSKRLTQAQIDSLTEKIHNQLSKSLAEILGGNNDKN